MNVYAAAITELEKGQFSPLEIMYEIAKRNPGAFVSAVIRLRVRDEHKNWKRECTELMRSGLKIDAITVCRAATGMLLKEAKDAVEALPL